MIGLREVAAEHRDTTKEHLTTVKEQLQLQQSLVQQELSDKEAKCRQMFRLTDSTNDTTYEWYKDRVDTRVEGTCKWFLNHENFRTWKKKDSGHLLISADPGCGKSVLAKYLIDHVLKDTGATICYFFFKDQDQNTVRQALCALLHQLFTKKPTLVKHAMKQYSEDGSGLVKATGSLWKVLRSATQDPEADHVIMVLDALDECAEEDFASLIRNIQEQSLNGQSVQGKLRYILTSRPYSKIISRFHDLLEAFPNIHIPGEEASEAIGHEVNRVVEYRLDQLSKAKHLKFEVKNKLQAELLKVTHRTYLWVYLVFEYLEHEVFDTRLDRITATVAKLPRGIDDAYEKILSKSNEDPMVRKALSIIFAANRPLTLEELNIAVELNEKSRSFHDLNLEDETAFKERLRNWCGLFVSVHGGKVYFLHQTAREFLSESSVLSRPGSPGRVWHRSIHNNSAHALLAEICMLYLDLFNCNAADAHGERGGHSVADSAFLYYSAQNWGEHFRAAGTLLSDGNLFLALKICDPDSESYSRWFQVWWDGLGQSTTRDFSALMVASFLGLERLAERLLKQDAEVELKDTRYRRTPLSWAAENGHEGVVKLLLETGKVDPDSRDEVGQTPLSWAARRGHEGVVKLLLETGRVDLDSRDNNSQTPLSRAAEDGHEGVVKLLLETGKVDLDSRDTYSRTPLSWAARNGHEGVIKLLLKTGKVDLESRDDEYGRTPLSWAAEDGHEGVVKLLLETGKVDPNSEDNFGHTPLSYATRRGDEVVAGLLTEAGGIKRDASSLH